MSASSLDRAAREVLSHYPALPPSAPPLPLGNRGGFSGARLWRVETPAGPCCLRAWPPGEDRADRLDHVHRLQHQARLDGLAFVPLILPADGQATWVRHAGRLWEVAEWLPGRADFWEAPSAARLGAACAALARLHRSWQRLVEPGPRPCPAVLRRLEAVARWDGRVDLPPGAAEDPVAPLAGRAGRLVAAWIGKVPGWLEGWTELPGPVQPCLCDVWHDHVLFEGDRVTGLVDYGAVKPDHVAVDLARLLGSLAPDDPAAWAVGLRAYREVRPLSDREEELARVLDRTGAVLGLANWLRWLYAEHRVFEDPQAVAGRLARLVDRVERWGRGIP